MEDQKVTASHSQYHDYWCPSDAQIQGISMYDINLICMEYFILDKLTVTLYAWNSAKETEICICHNKECFCSHLICVI